MNIFILDRNPVFAAHYLCDKHVVKMCLETAQILSTINGGPYKATHKNHPCVLWAGRTIGNYNWLYTHGVAIANEYTFRFGKTHKSKEVIEALQTPVVPITDTPIEDFVLCMPDNFKIENPVSAYRNYYMTKRDFCKWTNREIPNWFVWRLDNIIGDSE